MASASKATDFEAACNKSGAYPSTLLRKAQPHERHLWKSHEKYLDENSRQLFSRARASVQLWETGQDNKFEPYDVKKADLLLKHLRRPSRDPMVRHAFLNSHTSRSPLNCDVAMMKALFTYHQVDASFLDSVFAFGRQDEPKDMCLMQLQSLDTSMWTDERVVKIPELGRSGKEIHVSFLLQSVERSSSHTQPDSNVWPWAVRQAAVYSSFDIETGRAFWLTVKGNNLFQDRIQDGSDLFDLPLDSDTDPKSRLHASFRGFLSTYLVYVFWCDENWRGFINDMEEAIRDIIQHARLAAIDDHFDHDPEPLSTYPPALIAARTNTGFSAGRSVRRVGTANTAGSSPAEASRSLQMPRGLVQLFQPQSKNKQPDLESGGNSLIPLQPIGGPPANQQRPARLAALEEEAEEALNKFRFKDLQSLQESGEQIGKAMLTLKLNIGVLDDMQAFFAVAANPGDVPTGKFAQLKEECRGDTDSFLHKIRSIKKRLETRHAQLECLETQLLQGASLYKDVLQYRSLHINEWFLQHSQDTAKEMQMIAKSTAIQTSSMHTITIVTLIFLPATFVAVRLYLTFFQSGVSLWNEQDAEEMPEEYRFEPRKMELFAAVCMPIMALTLGAWLYFFIGMRRKGRSPLVAEDTTGQPLEPHRKTAQA